MATKGNNIFIGPNDGAYLPALDITHKVTVENLSSGAFTTIEASLPPGAMIPPHTHTREDECNFVVDGELTLDVGGEIVIAPVGSFVVKPRGVYHALCNTGTEPVRFVEIHSPGEFENYYDEYEEIAMSEEYRVKARAELGERYGVTWHNERIPEAEARFGIGP